MPQTTVISVCTEITDITIVPVANPPGDLWVLCGEKGSSVGCEIGWESSGESK
jgi:hypothetical protein